MRKEERKIHKNLNKVVSYLRLETDQVPARLTAGEFVMSKGAVEKYGVNTLSAMNAAGGGTNIPTITNEYNNGGIVDRSRYYNMMGSPMVRANNTQKLILTQVVLLEIL